MFNLLYPSFLHKRASLGLLMFRLGMGAAFVFHGWYKLQASAFGWMGPESPIPGALQFAAAFSEFAGGILLILGLLTPLASLMLFGTMIGALGLVHLPMGHAFVPQQPGQPSYELALVYFLSSLGILLTGPGQYSVDALLFSRKVPTTQGVLETN